MGIGENAVGRSACGKAKGNFKFGEAGEIIPSLVRVDGDRERCRSL